MAEGSPNRLVSALAALLAWCVLTVGLQLFLLYSGALEGSIVASRVGWPFAVVGAFLMVLVLYYDWQDVGVERAARWRDLLLLWLPGLYLAVMLWSAVNPGVPPLMGVFFILLNSLLIGFSEELMFRGILFSGLRARLAMWPAIWITTALFSLVHFLNIFLNNSFSLTVIQSAAAFFSGLLFLAIRLRTGSLWPAILLHALWDFGAFLIIADTGVGAHGGMRTGEVNFWPVVFVLPMGLYGLFLMRRISRDPVALNLS